MPRPKVPARGAVRRTSACCSHPPQPRGGDLHPQEHPDHETKGQAAASVAERLIPSPSAGTCTPVVGAAASSRKASCPSCFTAIRAHSCRPLRAATQASSRRLRRATTPPWPLIELVLEPVTKSGQIEEVGGCAAGKAGPRRRCRAPAQRPPSRKRRGDRRETGATPQDDAATSIEAAGRGEGRATSPRRREAVRGRKARHRRAAERPAERRRQGVVLSISRNRVRAIVPRPVPDEWRHTMRDAATSVSER